MNILFITYDFPYPTTSGGKVRAFNLLKYASKGVKVHLFSFARSAITEEMMKEMKNIGVEKITTVLRRPVKDIRNLKTFISSDSLFKTLYYDPAIAKQIQEIITHEAIDVLHCESFYTAYYLEDYKANTKVKKIYGSENIEYKLYEEYTRDKAPVLLRPLYSEQAKRIKREEERIATLADVTLAVTEKEKAFFTQYSPHVAVIENGVSLAEFSYKKRKNSSIKTILFVGNFNYFPNKDAVTFFYEEVLTKLDLPTVTFKIIGKGSSQFTAWQDKRVETIEFIDDIRSAYYDADIFVSPIRIGGGTNFKILEAMACGLPVISFADRVREIGATHDKDVLVADDGKSFLNQTQRLLTDPKLGESLAINARGIIEKHFSWESIGKHLKKVWENHETD